MPKRSPQTGWRIDVRGLAASRCVVLALALLTGLSGATSWADTPQQLDGGRAGVTFPRGTPGAVGGKDTVLSVRDANETFIAMALDEPARPELRTMIRNCLPTRLKDAQGQVSTRCWLVDGDPVKQVTTVTVSGDLMAVRLTAHAGRVYQAEYVRRGGSGPISVDGERFLASLHVNH